MWLATPEPREPASMEGFLERYSLSEQDVALMMVEPGFWLRVAGELTPWRRELARVRQACLNNALDPTRADQAAWMDRFERICKIGRGFLEDQESEKIDAASAPPTRKQRMGQLVRIPAKK